MRIPTDKSLSQWIMELMHEDRLYRFYKTDEWKDLRQSVLDANHNECALCKLKEPAEYTAAVTVHHVNEVKHRPELALSRTYRDAEGTHDNLLPLCARCHNEVHDRFNGTAQRSEEPLTEERW